ncbi:histidine ammonia-lyase [Candidatus Palauibacter polyketidifaciens]|uniref:histidine ammonia-lyase n=1 Tax=Candidatus Palauibacter polyketidifaciens TaxID=3056740 RepID=UPI00139B27D9|nr:histidine ammonia-lyase [Candidatus Palauibacter polyketidifaciens]MDE2719712.1 histidine ammonia-lyase [Candidatus Palauibacter polyketidifaciens]MYE35645.1 histidine ammonia-lyase [Gemmatimonadales bacterium]
MSATAVPLSRALSIPDVVAVARGGSQVRELDGVARERVEASRNTVVEALDRPGARIYGITTGYGALAGTRIEATDAARLSWNLILKCATGTGPPLPEDWVRAMLLVRANSLALGASGVRPVIIDTLVRMLNRGVTPVVPAKGSLGASGDLAPLAHMAAVATRSPGSDPDAGEGEDPTAFSGEAWFEGRRMDGASAMAAAGISRPGLQAKEGLALTNGTTMMVAGAALQLHDARRLLLHAEMAAALSFEALLARTAALHPRLHEANNQPGQIGTAERLRSLLSGSALVDTDVDRVQDAYSLRCTPQVMGPVHDMAGFLWGRVEASLNAVSDNPLIFPAAGQEPGAFVSGGNFHGAGPALWLDTLGIALADVASLSDRRMFRMLTPELSAGLPAMLVESPGLHGGLMSLQYTGAALVSDNKTLAHPDSVDSIPTSANQEDHVSMGANAARHAGEILDNTRTVLAIELLGAAQAVYLRPEGPDRLGAGTRTVYEAVRECVPPVIEDRSLAEDVVRLEAAIDSGTLERAAAEALGDLWPPAPL